MKGYGLRGRQISREYELSDEGIDLASGELVEGLLMLGAEKTEAQRLRISMEEMLLNWRAAEGMSGRFTVKLTRRLKRLNLTVSCEGVALDPLSEGDSELYGSTQLGRTVLESLGVCPAWQYRNGLNSVSVTLVSKKKLSQLAQVGLAIVLALALGFSASLLPDSAQSSISEDFIAPVFEAFLGALSCVVAPMMFLSMVWGIFNIGDAQRLGRIGGRLFIRFISVSALYCLFCTAVTLLLLRPSFSAAAGEQSIFGSLFQMIVDIVPSNIVEPFITGNTLQILFMGIACGVAMIVLGEKMHQLGQLMEQANSLVQYLLSLISSLVPYFIFLSVLRLILDGQLAQNARGILLALLISIGLTLFEVVLELLSLRRLGIGLKESIRRFMPPYLVALSTASSSAAFAKMQDCMENKMGVDKSLTGFALPFGVVIFKPHAANLFFVVTLFAADICGVELSLGSVLMCALSCIVLSVAAPPVPGGALSCFTLLFMQMGIPLEGISLAAACSTILDFTVTSGNVLDLTVQLSHSAKSLNMLDESLLHGEAQTTKD